MSARNCGLSMRSSSTGIFSGNLVEMQPVMYSHCVCDQRFGGQNRRDIMFLVIIHHIICGDKHRDISACLRAEIIVYTPEIMAFRVTAGTAQSLVDIAGTAVIRRYSQ